MSFKDILVLTDPNARAVVPYAISVASRVEAHLTAAALIVDPTANFGFLEGSAAFVASYLEKSKAAAQQSLSDVANWTERSGVALQTEVIETGIGAIVETLGPRLRTFDLVIAEQPQPDVPSEQDAIIETALFGAGRPLLVVPYVHSEAFRTETIIVAWDGSAPAARALGDAMPVLAMARRVEIVVVTDASDDGLVPGPEVKRHLMQHGIKAELRRLAGAGDVANTLLSHAADSGADLLVMGGYGHSRFRELILGGATRDILDAMTLPVFMSH